MLHDREGGKEEDHKSPGSALAVPEPLVSHSAVTKWELLPLPVWPSSSLELPSTCNMESTSSRRVWKLDELACGKHGGQIPQTLKKKKKKKQHWLLLQEIHHQVVVGANNKHMQKHILDKEWMRLWLCLKRTSSPQKHIKDKFMAYTTRLVFACFKILQWGISLVIQKVKLCTPNVGCLGSIAGQGPDPTCHNSRVRMLQLRPGAVERKTL